THPIRAGMAVALLLCGAGSALEAQTLAPATPRANNGLFGPTQVGDQSLDLTISALEAYDDHLVQAGEGSLSSGTAQAGLYGRVAANVAYAKTFSRGELALAEGSSMSYYPTFDALTAFQHSMSARGGLRIGRAHL